MQYALLIFQDEVELRAMPKSDQQQIMDEWLAFNADLEEADQLRGSTPLQLSSTAKTVSVRGGQVLTTDGPYAETKEQFGGLYLVEPRIRPQQRSGSTSGHPYSDDSAGS